MLPSRWSSVIGYKLKSPSKVPAGNKQQVGSTKSVPSLPTTFTWEIFLLAFLLTGPWIKLMLFQETEKKKKSAKQTHDWAFLLQASLTYCPQGVELCTPAQFSPSLSPHSIRRAPLRPPNPTRSSMEGPVVPSSGGWSCQLQGWRIWGWLSEHSELRRDLKECKLGLHKTLTHAEKSRVLKVSAEEWAKPQAACCLQINRNWGMPGTSENLTTVQGFLKFCHYSQEKRRATCTCQGENVPLCYFKGNQRGHFSFTHWTELLKIE